MNDETTVRVSMKTHGQLKELCKKDESFDSKISQLINFYNTYGSWIEAKRQSEGGE